MNPKLSRLLIITLLMLMLGRFAAHSYSRAITNSNSAEGDQSAFLQLGLDLNERGTLTDGTRNPLYATFLALIARRDWSYFTWAKLLSMLFGGLSIMALYLLGSRYFNRFTGLAAAYLLSINAEFAVHSATALTESLLTLTFILAGFAMITALDTPRQPERWVIAGLMTGFAYLAKGSGQLLMIAFVAGMLLIYGLGSLREKRFWFFIGGFALVASPLWIFNTVHFGSPTFNYPTTHQMWMNRWADWHPDAIDTLPTALTYLRDHSLPEIFAREWDGMKALRNVLVKTLWPTRTLKIDHFLLSPLSGYTLTALALLPFIFRQSSRRYIQRRRSAVTLFLLTTLIFYVMFAWYVPIISLGQRFLLPIIPFIFLLTAHIASEIWQKLTGVGPGIKRAMIAISIIALIWQGHWAVRTTIEPTKILLTRNLFEQDRLYNEDAATILRQLANGIPTGSVVAWGPPQNSLPAWAFSDRLNFVLYPPHIDTVAALTQNLTARGVAFVIVEPDMVNRYDTLAEFFPVDGNRVAIKNFPADWSLTAAHRAIPCDWCAFRVMPAAPAQHTVDYQLGATIRLTSYDLSRNQFSPGETIALTLHWQAEVQPEQDFTVFTQLLGPDGQLHGQMDHPPLNSLWPTSRWQTGQHLADRYNIVIDDHAPVGPHQILIGMYNSQTGERLAITRQAEPVSNNAIRLAEITVAPAESPN